MFICDISILNRMGKSTLDEKLRTIGFTWREAVVLMILDKAPGAAQQFIGRFLQTDKANVSHLIRTLGERDLIKKAGGGRDRRYKGLYLTEKSYEALPAIRRILDEWEKFCYAGLSRRELAAYQELNRKIIENLTAEGGL